MGSEGEEKDSQRERQINEQRPFDLQADDQDARKEEQYAYEPDRTSDKAKVRGRGTEIDCDSVLVRYEKSSFRKANNSTSQPLYKQASFSMYANRSQAQYPMVPKIFRPASNSCGSEEENKDACKR